MGKEKKKDVLPCASHASGTARSRGGLPQGGPDEGQVEPNPDSDSGMANGGWSAARASRVQVEAWGKKDLKHKPVFPTISRACGQQRGHQRLVRKCIMNG